MFRSKPTGLIDIPTCTPKYGNLGQNESRTSILEKNISIFEYTDPWILPPYVTFLRQLF